MEAAVITPYLALDDCAAAIRFYADAFRAVETSERYTDGDGRIGHAEIRVFGVTLFVSDEYPDYGVRRPKSLVGFHGTNASATVGVTLVVARAGWHGTGQARPLRFRLPLDDRPTSGRRHQR